MILLSVDTILQSLTLSQSSLSLFLSFMLDHSHRQGRSTLKTDCYALPTPMTTHTDILLTWTQNGIDPWLTFYSLTHSLTRISLYPLSAYIFCVACHKYLINIPQKSYINKKIFLNPFTLKCSLHFWNTEHENN